MDIFLDEAGGLGKADRYFTIAALIPSDNKRIKNIISRLRVEFAPEGVKALDEIKGSTLTFARRQKLLTRLNAKDDFHLFYIIGDKNHIEKKLLDDSNLCFNYLMGYLMKRIIEKMNIAKDEDINLYFDNRNLKVTSKNSLPEYLRIKAYTRTSFKGNLYCQFCDSKKYASIQMIDALASTIYRRYKYGKAQHHLYSLVGIKNPNYIHFPINNFSK